MKYYLGKICSILKGLGIAFLILCVISICWCRPMNAYYAEQNSEIKTETIESDEKQYIELESWQDDSKEYAIVYDNTIGVKYFVEKDLNSKTVNPSYKPLYNEDGSLQIYDGFEK